MKQILIHASEAGAASFIKLLEDPLKEAGYKLFYDLVGRARDILPFRAKADMYQADLIICGYDRSEIDQTHKFIRKTKTLDCPKIGFLDAWRGIDRFWYKNGDKRVLTDFLFVPDSLTKNYLVDNGLPNEWPIIVGHPGFDRAKQKIKNNNLAFKENIKAKFNLDKDKQLLLFLSEPLIFPDQSSQSLLNSKCNTDNSLREWIEVHYGKDFELMCRLHPIEKNQVPKNWHDVRNFDLDELIDVSDIILGLASTPIAYSIAAGKEVINIEEILIDWEPEQSDMPQKYWEDLKGNGIFSHQKNNNEIKLPLDPASTNILNFINTQI